MKKKPAIIAAFFTTLVIAIAMLLVGVNAFYNPNTVPVSNAPAAADTALNVASDSNVAAVSANTSSSASTSDQVKQLQSLVAQYQQQAQQYQQQIQTLQTQLNQATTASQQYQSLLSQLQTRGVIRIDNNGNVFITRRGD